MVTLNIYSSHPSSKVALFSSFLTVALCSLVSYKCNCHLTSQLLITVKMTSEDYNSNIVAVMVTDRQIVFHIAVGRASSNLAHSCIV